MTRQQTSLSNYNVFHNVTYKRKDYMYTLYTKRKIVQQCRKKEKKKKERKKHFGTDNAFNKSHAISRSTCNANFVEEQTGKQTENKWLKIDSRSRNLRWCRATMDLLRATSAESKKEIKKNKKGLNRTWIIEIEEEPLERGCGKKRLKNGRCFRRCTKGKCSTAGRESERFV